MSAKIRPSLDHLPLTLPRQGYVSTGVWGLFTGAFMLLSIPIFFGITHYTIGDIVNPHNPPFVLISYALDFAIVFGVAGCGVWQAYLHIWVSRHDRILIDLLGIEITQVGKARRYLWREIAEIGYVDIPSGRYPIAVPAIRLKGKSKFDTKTDSIRCSFGVEPDDLIALIRAAITRWGD
jgi:hypothetical protein